MDVWGISCAQLVKGLITHADDLKSLWNLSIPCILKKSVLLIQYGWTSYLRLSVKARACFICSASVYVLRPGVWALMGTGPDTSDRAGADGEVPGQVDPE